MSVSSLRCFVIINRVFIQASCDSAQGRFWEHTGVFPSLLLLLPLCPSPAVPKDRDGDLLAAGHCLVGGVTVSIRQWPLLHHCALLGDVHVRTRSQPQNGTKAVTEGKPMLCLPLQLSCGRKARARRNNVIVSLLLGQSQAVFLFPLLLMLHLQAPLAACPQGNGETRLISLSNQDFVFL